MLSLRDGHVVLFYKSKTEHLNVKSKVSGSIWSYLKTNNQYYCPSSQERIDDGIFHHIKASRRRRAAIIQIDDYNPVRIVTETSVLTTNGKLFVGGKPGHRGIKGCITDFIIDKRRVSLARRRIDFCHDNDV